MQLSRDIFRTQSSIYNGAFLRRQLMTKTTKKLHHRCFLTTPLHSANLEILHQTHPQVERILLYSFRSSYWVKRDLYKNWSSSKSCVKLLPRNMVNIIFSAFLDCELCDRYSSKFVFKVSNSYLGEYLFVALQSYVFFPLLNFYVFLFLMFFFCSLFLYLSLFNKQPM